MIEIKVSDDHDRDFARDGCRWWAALALRPQERHDVDDDTFGGDVPARLGERSG